MVTVTSGGSDLKPFCSAAESSGRICEPVRNADWQIALIALLALRISLPLMRPTRRWSALRTRMRLCSGVPPNGRRPIYRLFAAIGMMQAYAP